MKRLFKIILRYYYHFKFFTIIKNSKFPIVIIDIDNTIADTWPSINKTWNNTYERHLSLSPFEMVIDFINNNYPSAEYQWIYLTSRKYQLNKTTKKWLLNSGMPVSNNIIIVQQPSEKIQLFKKYLKQPFVYFDDLSYNHENGEIKFYENEIQYIKLNKEIEYYGYDELIKLQTKR